MRQMTRLSWGLGFVCTLGFAGCSSSDDNGALHVIAKGGSSQAGSGNGGSSTTGGSSTSGGTLSAAGSGGDGTLGGTAGLGGGAGTLGTAGTGGTSPMITPAVVLFDSILIREKSAGGVTGEGGAGGADGQAGAAGNPGEAGAAGSGEMSLAGAPGAAGGPSMADHSRSFTFDTLLQMWALHAEGSTPSIGLAGGGEKLSARSALAVNTTDGSPTPGSLQITIPFSATAEQLDVNQLFAAAGMEEDWTGYEMVAKLKVLSSGSMPDCLGAWLYATSSGYVFARGAEVQAKPADGWVNVRFDLDAPDVGGSTAAFDKTLINQFGVMVETNHCP